MAAVDPNAAPQRPRRALPRSDAGIVKLPVPELLPAEYGDGSGLRLRVNPAGKSGRGGAKVWRWFVVLDGERRNVTLGAWSPDGIAGLSLSQARQELDRLKREHQAGRLRAALDELEAKRSPVAATGPAGEPTVDDVAKAFVEFIRRRRKNPQDVEHTLDADILPAIGKRPIRSVTSREVRELVERVVERGASTHAGRVMAHVKQLFKFAQGRDDVQANPAAPLTPEALGVVNRRCDRFLSPAEIAEFWHALDGGRTTPTVRDCLRLLLLLGVRTGELLRAQWPEFSDLDAAEPTWTVPAAHQKLTKRAEAHARPWAIPLPPPAVAIFRELKAFADSLGSKYVAASFAGKGEPLSEKSLGHAMRKLFEGSEPLLKFAGERPTPHDLRRTLRTHLGDTLEVDFHIAERCLNHSLGRVAGIYDRGDYLPQRRAALEKWASYVERLIEPGARSVAFLPALAGAK
jgi:integrase